jgi:hypothetical protein
MIKPMTSDLPLDEALTCGIPNGLSMLRPTSETDYRRVEQAIRGQRAAWVACLRGARKELKLVLKGIGLRELDGGERAESAAGRLLPPESYLLFSRLKSPEAILRKMARFGEELCCMLDIWGIRLVVTDAESLDAVAKLAEACWRNVPERQLMLRGGQMRFPPVRDYRAREQHVGRSGATSLNYNEAVHVNRRAPFGVVEIQVMTHDLFLRAFRAQGLEESHRRFAHRRARALSKRD